MGVSHALRGEDHLTNTPRQLLILRALGLPQPAYGHIAMIVGDDGTPLSKRHGSQSLQDLRENGWLPEGLLNYLARLGHTYSQDEFMDLPRLAEYFTLERLGRAPARFDPRQMQYWQQQAVAHVNDERLWQWLGRAVDERVPASVRAEFLATVRPNLACAEDGLRWAGVLFEDNCPLDREAQEEISGAGADFFSQAYAALEQSQGDWQNMTQLLKQTSGKKGKALFMPLRAALTGMTHGPEMPRLLELMGLERARQRLARAGS
jgi:glutamyl-tRNA synthetase